MALLLLRRGARLLQLSKRSGNLDSNASYYRVNLLLFFSSH